MNTGDTKINDSSMNPADNTLHQFVGPGTPMWLRDPHKDLRLSVMMTINRPDEYYKQSAKSLGMDIAAMQHDEICAFTALLKCVEADILIATAFEQNTYEFTDGVQKKIYDHIAARMNEPTL